MTGTATPHLTRRRALALAGASAGAALLGGRAFAQAADLTVFGHRVHQAAATTGPAATPRRPGASRPAPT
jgi:multiple sugar transport system substrate-binding protein